MADDVNGVESMHTNPLALAFMGDIDNDLKTAKYCLEDAIPAIVTLRDIFPTEYEDLVKIRVELERIYTVVHKARWKNITTANMTGKQEEVKE